MGVNASIDDGDVEDSDLSGRSNQLDDTIAGDVNGTHHQQVTSSVRENPLTSNGYEDVVPTVFKWGHGGKNVYVTGTFNNWEGQIPMHRSGQDFTCIYNLRKGKHAFKFVVDDEWRFAPDQPTVADIEGQISNFIDVSEFKPYQGDENYFDKSAESKMSDDLFHQKIPELDEYTKEPPALPPQLRHIILNKPSPTNYQMSLPSPNRCSINHILCTAIKDSMMVLGATQRYKEKYVTIVFYSVVDVP